MDEQIRRVRSLVDHGELGIKGLIRCEQPHEKGSRPMLARAYRLGSGVLFTSKIPWLKPDRENTPPWSVEAIMVTADLASMTDDNLEELQTSILATDSNRRWIHKLPVHSVREWIDQPDPPVGSLSLWIRCKDHPGAAEAVREAELLEKMLGAPRRR